MAGVVKSAIVIGLILLLLFLSGIVGFLISQPPRQITLTLTETIRETLTLRSVDMVTITTTRTITSTRTTTVTVEATLTKKEQAPPRIVNLSWEPARIVNDKIYDIRVRFLAISDVDPIVSAKLLFTPEDYRYFITRYGMRSQDYEIVFQNDTRIIDLYPVDGVFNSTIEEFTTLIQNITGGVEYRIKVVVKDSAGREATTETKTPYIRQYENIASLDNVTIMTTYLLWYRADKSNWKDGHKHRPLLGEYTSNDHIVMLKHIDWATGYGIDGFFVSWNGYEKGDLKYFDSNLKILLNTSLATQIKIAILYESIGRLVDSYPGWNLDDERNVNILKRDLSYLAENYFSYPSCLRIKGKPVIYFYEGKGIFAHSLYSLKEKLDEIREHIKSNYGFEIYWISDHVHPLAEPFHKVFNTSLLWGDVAKLFDGITTYGGYSKEHASPEEEYLSYLEQGFEKWYKFAEDYRLDFIPFALVGYDTRYVVWGDKETVPIDRDPNKFYERLELASHYLGDTRLLWIHEFNNFFEDTQIEPTIEEGFIFLQTLQKSYKRFHNLR